MHVDILCVCTLHAFHGDGYTAPLAMEKRGAHHTPEFAKHPNQVRVHRLVQT